MLPQNHFRKTHIGESEYVIKLLDGITGFRTAKDITKLILPLVGESFDAQRHDDVLHGAPDTFRQLALLLVEQSDKVDIEDIIFNRLFRYLVKDGEQVKVEDIIVGDYGLLIDLVMFAIKENFGKLFEGKGLLTRFQGTLSAINNQI
jgi:hypothetical protein